MKTRSARNVHRRSPKGTKDSAWKDAIISHGLEQQRKSRKLSFKTNRPK